LTSTQNMLICRESRGRRPGSVRASTSTLSEYVLVVREHRVHLLDHAVRCIECVWIGRFTAQQAGRVRIAAQRSHGPRLLAGPRPLCRESLAVWPDTSNGHGGGS
jgi:hypothetical protein